MMAGVDEVTLGLAVRALRRRRGWRQEDAAREAGVHRSTWSLLERGQLDSLSLPTLRACLRSLEVRLTLSVRWRGSELDRLLDEDHSGLQSSWKARLEGWEYEAVPEASFNHYGDRGRMDLLAWHAATRTLVVVEIKTLIVDAQGLLGPLDTKVRVAAAVARERGWGVPRLVIPALIVLETPTNRRRIARLQPLFGRFALRGRAAVSWLRRPVGDPGGLLILSDLSGADHRSGRRVGRDRVRLRR